MIYKFIIPGKPIPKSRPRFKVAGNRVITFDAQKAKSQNLKCILMQQMAQNRILRRIDGPICVNMRFHTSIPKSWSQRRRKECFGKPDVRRPDLDNYVKEILDVMNNLIYNDDNQVTELWCEKILSEKPRVEIFITKINGENMIKEHVATVKGEISIDNLNYLAKKANKLGIIDRQIYRVFMEEDADGKHYYFEVENIKKSNSYEDELAEESFYC